MALGTYGVLDKDGAAVTLNKIASGRQAAADSQGVVIATEDLAAINAPQANPGSDATKAFAVQGVTGGKSVSVAPTTQGYTVAVTLTRTADTTGYTANDALGASTSSGSAVLDFSGIGPSGPRHHHRRGVAGDRP
jgi:hypothetical protein